MRKEIRDQIGRLHCEDKPAVVDHQLREWWFCGQRHRLKGPAVIGPEFVEYWEFGQLKDRCRLEEVGLKWPTY